MTEPKPEYEIAATPAGIDAIGLLDMLRPWAGTPIPDTISTYREALDYAELCLLEMMYAVKRERLMATQSQANVPIDPVWEYYQDMSAIEDEAA
jgi:hypothetical protein